MAKPLLTSVVIAVLAAASEAATGKFLQPRAPTRYSDQGDGTAALSGSYEIITKFETSDCSGSPVTSSAYLRCASASYNETCYLGDSYGANATLLEKVPYSHVQEQCEADLTKYADEAYSDTPYLRLEYYYDQECTEYQTTTFYVADGECHALIAYSYPYGDSITSTSFRVIVNSNATITFEYYEDISDCTGAPALFYLATEQLLSTGTCADYVVMSSNADLDGNGDNVSSSEISGSDKLMVTLGLALVTFVVGLVQ